MLVLRFSFVFVLHRGSTEPVLFVLPDLCGLQSPTVSQHSRTRGTCTPASSWKHSPALPCIEESPEGCSRPLEISRPVLSNDQPALGAGLNLNKHLLGMASSSSSSQPPGVTMVSPQPRTLEALERGDLGKPRHTTQCVTSVPPSPLLTIQPLLS